MIRKASVVSLGVLSLSLAACGGSAGTRGSDARSPGAADPEKESIGDLAAAQGGIGALGGAGNREEGGATGTEVAMGGALRAEEVDKKKPVKLDGVLKEWGPRTAAREVISGTTSGVTFAAAVMVDDQKIYVAGEVTDPSPTRSGKQGAGDDHARLVLAFPSGRGQLKAYEVAFYPGKSGESAGAVTWTSGPHAGKEIAGAKIVENDEKGGFSFEASLPWSAFPEARTVRVGLRAQLQYHDGDGGKARAILATGPGSVDKPTELAPLPTSAEQAVVDGLLSQKNLAGEAPRIDVYADLAGDERKERVSVFGKFFTICGPGYRGGHQFFWRELAGDVTSLEARDLRGTGKDDLVVRRRVAAKGSVRDVVEVWSLATGDEPVAVFAQEASVASPDGKKRVTNGVRISQKEIEVTTEPAVGWDATSYKEGAPSDVEPILLPWGTVRSRTFKLEGGRFTKAREVTQEGTAPAAATGQGEKPAALPRDLPTPVSKPSAGVTGKQVLAAYYRDAQVPESQKPRFDLEVDADGDARPERILLVGRDIVVLGPGFAGGNGYAKLSLTQFGDAKDVGELTVRDVTGNGKADVLVRGVRRVDAPTGEKVEIDALFIYTVDGGRIARVFSIETGREVGGKRVQGLVQFVPSKSGKGFDVDVRPGVAKGFTEKTYPWPQDQPGGAIEPLLLPWGKIPSLRYVWNGTQYAVSR